MRIRAWNTQSKEMFSPEEMARDQMTLLPTGQFINVDSAFTSRSVIYSTDVMVPMLSSEVLDKDSREIFEGDIVKIDNIHYRVIFRDGIRPLCDYGVLRVVGNIYENPELLEKCE